MQTGKTMHSPILSDLSYCLYDVNDEKIDDIIVIHNNYVMYTIRFINLAARSLATICAISLFFVLLSMLDIIESSINIFVIASFVWGSASYVLRMWAIASLDLMR